MESSSDYRALFIDAVKVLESRRVDLTSIDGYEVPVDPAEAIFILTAGEVTVTIDLEAGRRRLVTIIPGATFGELAVIGQATRTADVRADRPSGTCRRRSSRRSPAARRRSAGRTSTCRAS